ncbi:MAG TPA: hypothetical protein DCY86_03900 [Bdellovibrionales bacterium]|nr:hypothetical protein [Bdellovibrionales bacterium]
MKLLLRDGQVAHVLLYGGRGGGKHQKGSDIELGHLCHGVVSGRSSSDGLLAGKEFEATWCHQKIRHDYKAYALCCFFLETINKLAPQASIHDWEEVDENESVHNDEMVGFFRVLSNALIYLDRSLNTQANLPGQLALFVSKLMLELGIFPILEKCVLSGVPLSSQLRLGLLAEKGGFADAGLIADGRHGASQTPLWKFLLQVRETRYPDFTFSEDISVKELVDYFLFHVHLHPFDFKTLSLVI